MKWTVLVATAMPADIAAVCRAAGTSDPVPWTEQTVAAAVMQDRDGILVVGADADLAAVARSATLSGRRPAIALLPSEPSDLLRMFGLDRAAILDRLITGTRYPADLGICAIGEASVPFIGHVVTRPRRGLGIFRDGEVQVVIGERFHHVRASRVVLANVQHLGGRTIAPRSALMDGRFDIQAYAGAAMIRQGPMRRSHLPDPAVWRRSAPQVAVSVSRRWPVFADGRAIGTGGFTAELAPGAFDLWI